LGEATREWLRERLEQILETLSGPEREVITLRYGVEDGYSSTRGEGAQRLGVEPPRRGGIEGPGGAETGSRGAQPASGGGLRSPVIRARSSDPVRPSASPGGLDDQERAPVAGHLDLEPEAAVGSAWRRLRADGAALAQPPDFLDLGAGIGRRGEGLADDL